MAGIIDLLAVIRADWRRLLGWLLGGWALFTLVFLLCFGLTFQMPLVMAGLTGAGIVRAGTWTRNWRWAVVGIFFFGAAITPDGSGLTMMMVSLPMLGLYGVGVAVAHLVQRGSGGRTGGGKGEGKRKPAAAA